jgi:hypothetical protein
MDDGPNPTPSPRDISETGRRFRPHRIELGDGEGLRLHADGLIERFGASGDVLGSWRPDDPDWPTHAIRFGLRPQPATVAPHGEQFGGRDRPPRW